VEDDAQPTPTFPAGIYAAGRVAEVRGVPRRALDSDVLQMLTVHPYTITCQYTTNTSVVKSSATNIYTSTSGDWPNLKLSLDKKCFRL